jgi:hypothetical protein
VTEPLVPLLAAGRSARLRYEPLRAGDAVDWFVALGGDDLEASEMIGRYIGGPDVTSVDALEHRIGQLLAGAPVEWDETWINLLVWLDDGPGDAGRCIGRVEATVHPRVATPAEIGEDARWAEVAYLIGRRWWGHGYGLEAAGWLIDRLVELGIDELWAAIHPDNAASVRLVERLGFEPVVVDAEHPPPRRLGSYDEGDLLFRRG